MRNWLAVSVVALGCLGDFRAESVPADAVSLVEVHPDPEIVILANSLRGGKLLDFEREEARRTICSRLATKPWWDAGVAQAKSDRVGVPVGNGRSK